MNEDSLRAGLPTHIGGMFLAAATLIKKLDRPEMSIGMLRASNEAKMFRDQMRSFTNWLNAALASMPEDALTPEERKFLGYWFVERDHADQARK